MISTRWRYALRFLIDLAEHETGDFIPMKDIARRQGISLKYLERILPILMKGKLVDGLPGKGGGYRLNRPVSEYVVGHILRLTEGTLAPVACLKCGVDPCPRSAVCKTLPMWNKFSEMTAAFLTELPLKTWRVAPCNEPVSQALAGTCYRRACESKTARNMRIGETCFRCQISMLAK